MKNLKCARKKNFFILTVLFLILFTFSITTVASQSYLNSVPKSEKVSFYDVQGAFNDYWKDKKPQRGSGWKPFRRLEWFWEPRVYPSGEYPDAGKIYHSIESYMQNCDEFKKADKLLIKADWKFVGPSQKPTQNNAIGPPGIGRISCIAFDPLNPLVIWAGAAAGGVWKSTTGGTTWTTFPFTNFLSIGISDIAVGSTNPNIVYAATGDANSAGFLGQNFGYSIGIIKTTDGGNTWAATNLTAVMEGGVLINRLLVHPTNSDILYVATNTGVYSTTDGGTSWARIIVEYCRDMEFKPGDPNTIFGAFLSSDFTTYSIKKYVISTNTMTKQVEFQDVVRIALATTKASPSTVYAIAVGTDLGFHSFWKTTNDGLQWARTADRTKNPNYLGISITGDVAGGQGIYDLCIAASPLNPNEIFIGGVNIWKSADAGNTWRCMTDWTDNSMLPWVHADHHSLEFTQNGILYSTNDGGIQKTTNGGGVWTDLSNGLEVMQLYRVSSARTTTSIVIAGSQDNGTNIYEFGSWKNVIGGDGMECLIDYSDGKFMYGSLYYGDFKKSTDGGQTFKPMFNPVDYNEKGAWVTPLVIHPREPKTLYIALKNVWKTTNRGDQWQQLTNFNWGGNFRSMAVSASNPSVMYLSAYKYLYKSIDGGTNWTLMDSSVSAYITSITIDPAKAERIWLTYSGYSKGNKVNVYDGIKWTNISGTLPNVPVTCMVYQKNSNDAMYIGTDIGVFTRDKTMNDWVLFNDGLPNIIINDLKINYATGELLAATYARGLWKTKISDCALEPPEIKITGRTRICKGDKTILECQGNFTSYRWSTGASGKSIEVTEEGEYYVTVTDSKNCTVTSDVIEITVSNPPDITIKILSAYPVCEGDSVELGGPGIQYATLLWSNGQTSRRIYAKTPGKYSVTGMTGDSCMKTSPEVDIIFYQLPEKPVISLINDELTTNSTANSYQWYYNGLIIQGANQKTYKPTKNGSYTLEIKNDKNCINRSEPYNFSAGDVTDNIPPGEINISPNPAYDFVCIQIDNTFNSRISLTLNDILGKEIYSTTENSEYDVFVKNLDIRDLKPGLYNIIISYRNSQYTYKLIKE